MHENTEWRKSFLYEYFQEEYAPGFVTVAGVRNSRFKYIEGPNLPEYFNELYDLETDPGEMNNLINSPEHQSIKIEMMEELQKLKTQTGYFDPKVYKEWKQIWNKNLSL